MTTTISYIKNLIRLQSERSKVMGIPTCKITKLWLDTAKRDLCLTGIEMGLANALFCFFSIIGIMLMTLGAFRLEMKTVFASSKNDRVSRQVGCRYSNCLQKKNKDEDWVYGCSEERAREEFEM
jgi:hypothetical protein